MGVTQVLIRDHVRSVSTTLLLWPDEKKAIADSWHDDDLVLKGLQKHVEFVGRTKWSDLDMSHFRVLIALHLLLLAELSEQEIGNDRNTVVRSFLRTLVAFVHMIETRAQASITLLGMQRHSLTNVVYDVTMSLNPMEFPKPHSTGLSVVVDNTRA